MGAGARRALALAMLADTAAAAARAPGVAAVHVVGSDAATAAAAAAAGARYLPEGALGAAAGRPDRLNGVLSAAVARLRREHPGAWVVVLHADLPALRPEEVAAALGATPAGGGPSFVADRAGTGTCAVLAPPGAHLPLRFGPGSALAHRAAGARPVAPPVPGLRADVDTPADLAAAVGLGVGRHTRAVLREPGLGHLVFTLGQDNVHPRRGVPDWPGVRDLE